jgi:prepilin peptidase CpaA
MFEAATLLFFPALMVFAAVSDLLTMTISNCVSITLTFLFIVMAFACGLPAAEIFWHLACGAAMLVLTFSMFARAIGIRKWPLPGVLLARQWVARLHEPSTGIPYGIALAGVGLLSYPETAIWLGAAAVR